MYSILANWPSALSKITFHCWGKEFFWSIPFFPHVTWLLLFSMMIPIKDEDFLGHRDGIPCACLFLWVVQKPQGHKERQSVCNGQGARHTEFKFYLQGLQISCIQMSRKVPPADTSTASHVIHYSNHCVLWWWWWWGILKSFIHCRQEDISLRQMDRCS